MPMTDDIREQLLRFILHPITALTTVFGLIASVFNIPLVDALVLTIWSKIGSIFTVLSIASAQFDGPVFGIPLMYFKVGATIAGVLFILSILDRVADSFIDRYRSESEEES